MQYIFSTLGYGILQYLKQLHKVSIPHGHYSDLHKIGLEYGSTFQLAAKYLNDELTSNSDTSLTLPSLLFFHVAIIIKEALYMLHIEDVHFDREIKFCHGLAVLIDALANYKTCIGNQHNETISKWFKENDYYLNLKNSSDSTKLFSNKWWASVFRDYAHCANIEINPEILQVINSPEECNNLPLPTIIFPSSLTLSTSSSTSNPHSDENIGTTTDPLSTTSHHQKNVSIIEALHPNTTANHDFTGSGSGGLLQSIPLPNLSTSHSLLSLESDPSPKLNSPIELPPTDSHAAATPLTHPQVDSPSIGVLGPSAPASVILATNVPCPTGVMDSPTVKKLALIVAGPMLSSSDATPGDLPRSGDSVIDMPRFSENEGMDLGDGLVTDKE
ncbi:hypothetical protein BDN70DRAFT_935331 [Pholiota conissans]|uniref:Uncharacterized protein n=1 Tax=Pholiota conissans TaxID=109636 RepID=A0A9P5YVU6_9AGAR|nr:hypothetical protein BDN70DRAFT_935331 [Pholiota conissans]